jgi:hypothetical protein
MDMTDRTLYTGIRPARSPAPPAQRNRRVEQMGGTHGGGDSRAKIDTVLARLKALGALIPQRDPEKKQAFVQGNPDKLRAWREAQMEQLRMLAEWRESPDTFGGLKKPKKA